METSAAVDQLAALAQQARLNIFRLLVSRAPGGLAAGAIARRVGLPASTLSFHLNVLAAAKLVKPHKNGRSISYSANLETVNGLVSFLLEECCGGRVGCGPFENLPDNAPDAGAVRKGPGVKRER